MTCFWMRFTKLGYINFSGRGEAFLLSLLLIISIAFFLFLLLSFYKKPQVVTKLLICQFWIPGLSFFCLKVLYQLGLGLSLTCRGMHRLVASIAILVKVMASENLNLCLGFNSNSSFS